ncbi:MAG: branched-chain amino acid ABC transporter permease, partial [Desulfobacterales bacterium]
FIWTVVLWLIVWGAVGAIVTPRNFLRKDLDVSRARMAGASIGAATGPFGLLPLWIFAPRLRTSWNVLAGLVIIAILAWAFALAYPANICITNGRYVVSLLSNGLIMGIIYGLMALGLSLIFSILGVVSFAHGEFYMVGGMVVYYFTTTWFPGSSPVLGLVAACVITFAIGTAFERIFLQPMYKGKVDRPIEYGILVTFGLAFFMQYFVQAIAGANPVKARRFFDFPILRIPSTADPWLIKTSHGNLTLFDTVSISNPRLTAAVISVLMLGLLLYFLYHTWIGKALRAVSQDRQAAAVAGINPDMMNTLAFALGGMLAALSGATLVQAFSWVPQVGMLPALRSFVIIVLGGLGSLPGAFLGGLIVGVIEAAGTGCVPDPSRASAYIPAYGMIVLILVLLLKPTGLFGRQQ